MGWGHVGVSHVNTAYHDLVVHGPLQALMMGELIPDLLT